MRRARLPERREDTYRRLSFEKQPMELASFASGLRRFLEERYRDAYTLEHGELHGYLEVSIEGVAFILREVLLATFGKSTVRLCIEQRDEECRITLSAREPLEIDKRVQDTLYAAAARSGVRLTADADHLVLSCAVNDTKAFAVYAFSSDSFYSTLAFIFDEI